MRESPKRKHPVHQAVREIVNRPTIVFTTVCTKDREPILASERSHECILAAWRQFDAWRVGRYVVMPDHVHLFCAPAAIDDGPSLDGWVRRWKAKVARTWPNPIEAPVWQKGYWDRQLRSSESYAEKWDYVRMNPVRHGLTKSADDWPYAGEIGVFDW